MKPKTATRNRTKKAPRANVPKSVGAWLNRHYPKQKTMIACEARLRDAAKAEVDRLNAAVAELQSKIGEEIRENDFLSRLGASAERERDELSHRYHNLQQLREGDFKLMRALAKDAGIPILSPDTQPGTQWGEFHHGVMAMKARLRAAMSLLECARLFARRCTEAQLTRSAIEAHYMQIEMAVGTLRHDQTKTETSKP